MDAKPKRLLIACDAPADAGPIPPAVASMARVFGAECVLLHVAPRVPSMNWRVPTVTPGELQASLVASREQALGRLATSLRGLQTSVLVRVGDPHVEIVRAAQAERCDLVVVLDDPKRRRGGRTFGTTTMRLLRKCPLPLWAVRAGSRRPKRILMAVDVGPPGDDANRPNDRIIEAACAFWTPRSSPILVLHVWSHWGEELLRAPGRMGVAEVDALIEETRHEHLGWLEAQLAEPSRERVPMRIELIKGDPTRVVPRVVKRDAIDLVVMGTVARRGLPGLLMGNTAERILNRVGTSVLALKPADVVSSLGVVSS